MTAEQAMRARLGAALRGHDGLRAGLNAVRDGEGGRASPPYAVIGEMLAVDWGTKTAAGRELRCAVTIRDLAETPARLDEMMALAGEAIEGMARDGDGWRVASLAFVRARTGRDGASGWIGVVEYRARMLAE